ncbi:DUF4185 domain-containing protein [Jiangella gansuensis]|uniref:DUF4185 domain-containing protein n=1 Tax=Jiangella gansuensis TaxID=281473 RepID=UPI000A04DEF5|nr:DUF4185 domain-containing protein [Jiangella gansuensis]
MRVQLLAATGAVALLLVASSAMASDGVPHAERNPAPSRAEPTSAVTADPAVPVARLTGAGSVNHTAARYQVHGTDLGIIWDNGAGEVLMAFGDTYGEGWGGNGAGPRDADWRCNVLARSSDTDLADGMTFDTMVQDRPGHAGQLLDCKQVNNDEETVIPTAGVTVDGRSYLHYMSVHHWGPPGQWFTNHAGIAYSDDNGETWTKDPDAVWTNTPEWSSAFQLAAFARHGGHVYLFGTPNGRFGDAHLARVPAGKVLDKDAYRYWNGSGWSPDEATAAPVAAGTVGELSVQYNEYTGRWLMTYLDESRAAIVLRDAPRPTGPWSNEQVIVSGSEYPALYGAFLHPWSSGPDLYFAMTQWAPYNVTLMRTSLSVPPR